MGSSRSTVTQLLLLSACLYSLQRTALASARLEEEDWEETEAPVTSRSSSSVQGRAFGGTIQGRILIPDVLKETHAISAPLIKILLYTSQGTVLRAYSSSDGTFIFHEVPVGAHLLRVSLLGVIFPEVRLDVNGKSGLYRASLAEARHQGLNVSPLLIRPVGVVSFFERRKPFDIRSIIMSPYGLMIGFSVLAIFVFPRMKVDPEEYKEFQQSLAGAGAGGGAAGAPRASPARIRDRSE